MQPQSPSVNHSLSNFSGLHNTTGVHDHMSLQSGGSRHNQHQDVSPGRIRIKQLSQKLNNMQVGIDEEKNARQEALDFKIKNLDQKMTRNLVAQDSKLKEQISKLQQGIGTQRMAREILDERKSKQLKLVQNNVTLELNVQKQVSKSLLNAVNINKIQSRKDTDVKLNKLVQEKVSAIKLQLAKERRAREQLEERSTHQIGDQITRLQEEIDMEQKIRQENSDKLLKKLTEEITNFHQLMNYEKRMREDSQNQMYRMIEDMHSKITNQIANEKKEREATQEGLLKLLEQTCSRVQTGLKDY